MKLSYSAVQKYIQCPRKYHLHYNLRIREEKMGSALLFGSAVDVALNALLEGKGDYLQVFMDHWLNAEINGTQTNLATSPNVIYYNGDFDPDVLLDSDIHVIFNYFKGLGYEFEQENLKKIHEELCQIKRDKQFGDDQKTIFNYISWYSLMRKGEMILDAYKEQIFPRIKRVIGVQKYFSVENEVKDELIGYIDMICEWEDGRIIRFDHKTSSSKYEESSVKESEQLATYVIATEDEFKEKTAGYIVFQKTIRKKKLPRVNIQVIIDEIPLELENKVLDEYDKSCQDIKDENFEQNLSSCTDSKGYKCAYYNLCHYQGDMTGLIKLEKRENK